MDCPNCGLTNPPSAERCDCGYDFPSGSMKQSYLTEEQKQLGKTGVGVLTVLALMVHLSGGANLMHGLLSGGSIDQRFLLPIALVLLVLLVVVLIKFIRSRNGYRRSRLF